MGGRPIQEQFGGRVIEAFSEFARAEVKPIDDLVKNEFAHVNDPQLRQSLAEVLFGARWLYKLGLALLVRDAERAAHVRAQILDYASVTEALLQHAVARRIAAGLSAGTQFQFADKNQHRKIDWTRGTHAQIVGRQNFWWLVVVASEVGVITPLLSKEVDWLRKRRNTVHLLEHASVGRSSYLQHSERAFRALVATIRATKKCLASIK